MAKGERAANKGIGSLLFGLINPIRDPSLLVAIILDVLTEASSGNPVNWVLFLVLYWVAVKSVIWLMVNFIFSFVYLTRKTGWVIRNPRLAWRLLDALGTEEIIIGGLRPDMFATEDGTLHAGQLGMMPGMMAAQYGYAGAPSIPAYGQGNNGYGDQGEYYDDNEYSGGGGYGNGYAPYERQPPPSMRLDEQSEELRDLLSSYSKLIADWMGFTEEKWRAVSDSQLGWKPLRGRWNGWEEIYSDSFGTNNGDANGALASTDAMDRRFDNAQTKGSAASSVACFLRDLDSLRQSMMLLDGNEDANMPRMGGIESKPQLSQRSVKSPIIRNPMIVDADR